MKYLLFFFLPLSAVCQQQVKQPCDTVRASLLLTRKKMTIAHNYEGHAVLNAGRVVEFLDDRKKRFPAEVIVWDYRLKNIF
jgi:hypothetical protein